MLILGEIAHIHYLQVVIKSVLCGLASIRSELRPGRKKEMKSTYNFYKLFG